MCVNDVNCYLIWQNNSPSVRWSARGLNASLCGVTAAALAVRFSVAWTRCILGSRNSRSYAFIASPILSCNDGRVVPIIISACMHKFRIIRVKLSSHSLLVGVMHSPTSQSSKFVWHVSLIFCGFWFSAATIVNFVLFLIPVKLLKQIQPATNKACNAVDAFDQILQDLQHAKTLVRLTPNLLRVLKHLDRE